MNDTDRQAHWQNVYATKAEKEVSWFQENPTRSLDMKAATGISTDAGILDVVGGASRLIDCLLDKGFSRLAILDLSAKAFEATKERLGRRGDGVDWIVVDVASCEYLRTVAGPRRLPLPDGSGRPRFVHRSPEEGRALRRHVIITTFAPDGPERCSGLPIVRYDPTTLASALGPEFERIDSKRHDHLTPGDGTQRLSSARFLRK